jgi:hypothetical protein
MVILSLYLFGDYDIMWCKYINMSIFIFYDRKMCYFLWEFSPKGWWKLMFAKGIKGKHVFKSDDITNFLWIVDVQSQIPLPQQILMHLTPL